MNSNFLDEFYDTNYAYYSHFAGYFFTMRNALGTQFSTPKLKDMKAKIQDKKIFGSTTKFNIQAVYNEYCKPYLNALDISEDCSTFAELMAKIKSSRVRTCYKPTRRRAIHDIYLEEGGSRDDI